MRAAGDDIVASAWAVESPIGRSVETFWKNLASGESGIGPITAFDASRLSTQIAGEVRDFDPLDYLSALEARRTSRPCHLLVSVAEQVMAGSGVRGERTGLIVGSGAMGTTAMAEDFGRHLTTLARKGIGAIDPFMLLKALPNMPTGYVAQRLGIHGPTFTVNTACASSTDAIGLGMTVIRAGLVDMVLVAGVDAWINEFSIAGFAKLQALSKRKPSEAALASRPFDADRDGLVPAEGAAALLLERRSQAERHGREPLCTFLGWASTNDAHHPVMPQADGETVAKTLSAALRDAGVGSDEIEFISAHGTSTEHNDLAETRAIKKAFGPSTKIPVSASKSVLGHTLGASGIIESIGVICAILHEYLPPTINLSRAAAECDLDYVANRGRAGSPRLALKCSIGFGGQNAALVLGRAY